MRSGTVRGGVWVVLYLLFILAPLFALLTGSLPPPATSGRSSRSRSVIPAWP